jgi:hypothetical protein
MSIRICTSEEGAWLYNSVTMHPLDTEAFENEADAAAFLKFADGRGFNNLAKCSASQIERLIYDFLDMPKCGVCHVRMTHLGRVCEGCL